MNRLPTRVVEGKTTFEAWSGNKPSAQHLKILDSIFYTHVPNVTRSKLDDKAEVRIFIGYGAHTKGYRVYNIHNGKIQFSRDIQIDEMSH